MKRLKTAALLAITNGRHGWAISTAVPRTMEGSVKTEHSRISRSGFSDSLLGRSAAHFESVLPRRTIHDLCHFGPPTSSL